MLTVGLRAFSGNDPHLPLEIELAFGRADRFANAYSEQQLQLETVAYPLGELRWRVELAPKNANFVIVEDALAGPSSVSLFQPVVGFTSRAPVAMAQL